MQEQAKKSDWKTIAEKISKAKEAVKTDHDKTSDENFEILRKRAEDLAHFEDKSKADIEQISVLEFILGQEKYAIKTENLKEIIESNQITEIPCTPAYIYGVINIRGKIVTVIDLKKYLKLDYVGINDRSSIIVAMFEDNLVGIVADMVTGIKTIEVSDIQKTTPTLKNIKDSYVHGITSDTIIILEIDRILSDNAILVNDSST